MTIASKDIIDDVKLQFLDFISLSADLRALSLTSRAWNHVATPRLYSEISIDISLQGKELEMFAGCLDHGAERNMHSTRKLRFIDTEMDPADQCSMFPLRNDRMLKILSSLADHRLRSFSYLSISKLSAECVSYLTVHQKLIKDLHIPGHVPLELIGDCLTDLTVGLTTTKEKTETMLTLMNILPYLNSLSLDMRSGWMSPIDKFWDSWNQDVTHSKKKCARFRTKVLALSGHMPSSFTFLHDTLFDLSHVTHFILRDCSLDYLPILIRMERLTGFEIDSYEQIAGADLKCLTALCDQSPKLTDLRLISWRLTEVGEDVDNFADCPTWMFELPRDLSVLVLFDSDLTNVERLESSGQPFYFDINGMPDFGDHFCNLTELGLTVPHLPNGKLDWGDVDPSCLEENPHPLVYLNPILSRLQRLRLLHLYQRRLQLVYENNFRTPHQIDKDLGTFAMSVFTISGRVRNELCVLIWGVEHDYADPMEEDQARLLERDRIRLEKWPKHYYKKSVVTFSEDEYGEHEDCDCWDHDEGEEFVVAVRTTLDRLRDEFPELKLLSYDPTYNTMEHCASQT